MLGSLNIEIMRSFSILNESSHLQMFFKIGVLKNFEIFTEKDLCWNLFLIKLRLLATASVDRAVCSKHAFLKVRYLKSNE